MELLSVTKLTLKGLINSEEYGKFEIESDYNYLLDIIDKYITDSAKRYGVKTTIKGNLLTGTSTNGLKRKLKLKVEELNGAIYLKDCEETVTCAECGKDAHNKYTLFKGKVALQLEYTKGMVEHFKTYKGGTIFCEDCLATLLSSDASFHLDSYLSMRKIFIPTSEFVLMTNEHLAIRNERGEFSWNYSTNHCDYDVKDKQFLTRMVAIPSDNSYEFRPPKNLRLITDNDIIHVIDGEQHLAISARRPVQREMLEVFNKIVEFV